MADVCPKCLMRFPHHFVIKARCTKRWRGSNFDAAAAEGNVGAAVAGALGLGVRTTQDLQRFLQKAFIRAHGAGLHPNPEDAFDPSEGEPFEFHVGLREELGGEKVADVEQAAREAVAKSRHFELQD